MHSTQLFFTRSSYKPSKSQVKCWLTVLTGDIIWERQTDRQRQRQTDRDRERETDTHRETETYREVSRDREGQRDRQTDGDRDIQTDRQTDREGDREGNKDRQTDRNPVPLLFLTYVVFYSAQPTHTSSFILPSPHTRSLAVEYFLQGVSAALEKRRRKRSRKGGSERESVCQF